MKRALLFNTNTHEQNHACPIRPLKTNFVGMKTAQFFAMVALVFAIMIPASILAQPEQASPVKLLKCAIPGLTADQKAKMKDLRTTHLKEIKPLQTQMTELRTQKHILSTGEKTDMTAINANIDEMGKVQNQLMKARAHPSTTNKGFTYQGATRYFRPMQVTSPYT